MFCSGALVYHLLYPPNLKHIDIYTHSVITHVRTVFPISHWIFRIDKLTKVLLQRKRFTEKKRKKRKEHLHIYGKQNQIRNSIKVWSRLFVTCVVCTLCLLYEFNFTQKNASVTIILWISNVTYRRFCVASFEFVGYVLEGK